MARNSEKAMTLMNRWMATKESQRFGARARERPAVASQVKSIPDCQQYRTMCIKDFDKTFSKIMNKGLPEAAIRDLNDQLNKLLHEKFWWEKQIIELGGPDYISAAKESTGQDQYSGYKYFGAARELPGIKEMFEKEDITVEKKSRREIYKNITPYYFGYRDEDDPLLLAEEGEKEAAELEAEKISIKLENIQ